MYDSTKQIKINKTNKRIKQNNFIKQNKTNKRNKHTFYILLKLIIIFFNI